MESIQIEKSNEDNIRLANDMSLITLFYAKQYSEAKKRNDEKLPEYKADLIGAADIADKQFRLIENYQ